MGEHEGLLTLLRVLTYPRILVELAMGIGALVRFRGSPSGLLIGIPFLLDGLLSIGFRAYSAAALDPAQDDFMVRMQAASITGSCSSAVLMVLAASGIFLIPRSLGAKEAGAS